MRLKALIPHWLGEQVKEQLRSGKLEDQVIEIEVTAAPKNNELNLPGEATIAIGSIFGDALPKQTKKKNCDGKRSEKNF